MIKFKLKKIKYFIYVFLLLALSGNPFFSIGEGNSQYIFTGLVLLLILRNIHYFDIKKALPFYRFVVFYIIIFILQNTFLGFVSVPGAIGFLLKIILGYIIIRRVGLQFRIIYLKVMFFICLISIFGYMIINSGILLPSFIDHPKLRSIILYTQNLGGVNSLRNSGMFWEPGAFACYICLTFLLFLGEVKYLLINHPNKIFVVITALLTTYSTTGYLVIFMIICVTYLLEYFKGSKIFAFPVLLIFFAGAFYTYQNTDFLKEKIEHQFSNTLSKDSDKFTPDRFGAFLFDLHYINKHPLIGNGMHESTRYADHPWLQNEKNLGHGNGFSNFLATMGVISLLFYSFYILKYHKTYSWIFLIFIYTLLQGEQLLNYPLFITLPFLFIYGYNYSNSSYLLQSKAKNFKLSSSSL